jgi:CubicO group peptidase (beta-lactamase class C family)
MPPLRYKPEHRIRETATPEQVGLSFSRLADLHAAMQAFVDQGKFAGIATLIARRGQVVDFRQYGLLDIAANKPLRPDSLFRIASLAKPITSVATLMLHDEGLFDLDDPVSKWLPDFKNFKVSLNPAGEPLELVNLEKQITFRHLLTHTSGLGYGFMGGLIEDLYASLKVFSPTFTFQYPLSEFVRKLPALPLVAQPRTIWSYSLAHDVLGYLISVISDTPFDVFLRERIFGPLEMLDTGSIVPPDKLERFGPLYRPRGADESALAVVDEVASSPFVTPGAFPSGGGAMVSSVPDYFRFASMLANGGELDGVRLLRPTTFTAMTTNQLPSSANGEGVFCECDGYGLGVGVRVVGDPATGLGTGAFGWSGGFGTTAWIYPVEEVILIAMSQSFFDLTAVDTFVKMAYEAIVS